MAEDAGKDGDVVELIEDLTGSSELLLSVHCCHVADDLPRVSIPEFFSDAAGGVAVRCHHQRGDCREVTRDRWGSVVCCLAKVFQPDVTSFEVGGDLANALLAVLRVVFFIVIDLRIVAKGFRKKITFSTILQIT